MKSYDSRYLTLDYIIEYKCVSPSGAHSTYSFKRWKILDPKSDIGKWYNKCNQESEKAEKKFIQALNKLKWTFETNIITMEGEDYEK